MALRLRKISPTNLILTPIKQHIGCCVVAPLLVKLLGAFALTRSLIDNKTAEFMFLLVVLPPAVWGILKLEDMWRARHERKHSKHGEHCDHHCHAEPNDFKKRYWINLALAAVIALLMHVAFHSHTTTVNLVQ